MIEVQTAVDSMMSLILSGGAEAARDLVKGMVLSGAREVSQAWRDLFWQAPDAYPLADRVARNPADPALDAQLRALLLQVLAEHPELLPPGGLAVQTGALHADHGSLAAAVVQGTTITINNQ